MCDPVTALAIVGGVSAGASVVQGEQARKAQSRAARQARTEADRAFNRDNPKRPNAAGMMDEAQQAALSGNAGTMLTGPQGVNPASLTLGRNTLLGG